jgi:hypothetical protein
MNSNFLFISLFIMTHLKESIFKNMFVLYMSKHFKLIKDTYYNPDTGFIGYNKLYQKLKDKGVSRQEIKYVLERQDVHQLTTKNNQPMKSFIPRFPKQEYQMDLIFFEHQNIHRIKYGLSVIDVFSKKADVQLLKNKNSSTVLRAIQQAFNKLGGKPTMIYVDEGTEFVNNELYEWMNDNKIKVIITYSHAPFVERFNRTIKEMMEKYLQSHKVKDVASITNKLVDNYNNSYHSAIGMTPNQVNDKNMHIVQMNIIKNSVVGKQTEIKVGSKVRTRLKDKKLRKGYKPKWDDKVYTVKEIDKPYYFLEGDERGYLRSHLQLVKDVQYYKNEEREKEKAERQKEKEEQQFTKEIEQPEERNRPPRRGVRQRKETDTGFNIKQI